MKHAVIGTAGHIDHGKTTLVRALTGIDTDRFQEEKRRGISIDIGFAHMELEDWQIGFIDVPGHEKFVKNMLAGIVGVDLALLVIAADESVMPQTVEHFEICRLLGISKGLVAVTKKALVDEELLSVVESEIRELLQDGPFESCPIVPVDSVSGEGLDHLKEELMAVLEKSGESFDSVRRSRQVFRLPVDRVFTIKGFGTVVTGTPWGGAVSKGDEVNVLPMDKSAKIRGIEIFNQPAEQAGSGQRTALNLSGVEREDLERGMVLSRHRSVQSTSMIDALAHLLDRTPKTLKDGSAVRLHHGSGEFLGRIHLLEDPQLAPGSSMLVQLRLRSGTVCFPGDHFVLRNYSPMTTIGGGVVLDNSPGKHRKRDLPGVLPELRALASRLAAKDPQFDRFLVEFLVKRAGRAGISLSELVARTGFPEDFLAEILASLDSVESVSQDPLRAVFKPALEELKTEIVAAVRKFHMRHPLAEGLPREEIKERFFGGSSGQYLNNVLKQLETARAIQIRKSLLSAHGQEITLSEEQEHIRREILDRMRSGEYQPPTLNDLMAGLPHPADQVKDIYFYLLKQEQLVRVSQEISLPAGQADALEARLRQSFPKGRRFTVAEFKELFGVSRKYAIPLLEYLDRKRVTQRSGDERVVL